MPDIKIIALVFGIILLIVLGVRQAIKKVKKQQQESGSQPEKQRKVVEAPKLTDEQFNASWKSLSYLLLLAAAGSLYMVYVAVKSALSIAPGAAWVFWIDAASSFVAAVFAVLSWMKRTKSMVYLYFAFTILPIVIFMSIKGFKINALIHLFPLVLVYFVLKPIWQNMKD